MSDLTATTVRRSSSEPSGGILIGTAYVPAATTNDTITVDQIFTGVNRVLWATINGTSNHASVSCDLGGTAKITLGTGSITEGELLVIGTSQ